MEGCEARVCSGVAPINPWAFLSLDRGIHDYRAFSNSWGFERAIESESEFFFIGTAADGMEVIGRERGSEEIAWKKKLGFPPASHLGVLHVGGVRMCVGD